MDEEEEKRIKELVSHIYSTSPEEWKVLRRIKGLYERLDKLRLEILLKHLYIEFFINKVLTKKGLIRDKEFNMSFSNKLELLREIKLINPVILEKIHIINRIRNKLAHNLFISNQEVEKEINKIELDEGYYYPKEITPEYRIYDASFKIIWYLHRLK